ncbi:hypothetical protein PG993_011880 [Apiospora rasikravindrae]|uniref:Glucose-methanol-choline oxidoreductase N-terminal domain-containing protein n=1 Tax=Apiospora rasikravindrae TaxID=990691 RepID=A0ABR1S0W4_9PEZI
MSCSAAYGEIAEVVPLFPELWNETNANDTAVGVVHRPNSAFQPSADGVQSPPSRTTRAKRRVILTGGPFDSPLLLERSGIGHPQILERAGVPLVASVPGSLGPDETVDALNAVALDPATLIANGNKMIGWNAVDAQAKLRPMDADVVMLKIENLPDFDPAVASEPRGLDIKTHVWMYKKQHEVAHRMAVFRGEIEGWHSPIPEPAGLPFTEVQYLEDSADDDKLIEKWIRDHIDSIWHPMVTCKMAPFEKNGVVDATLGVYGVEGLKVADLSVCPQTPSSNCANTAITIAEKSADIFIKELGLIRKKIVSAYIRLGSCQRYVCAVDS